MAKFNEQHVFTGMQRDIDVSRHPASFLYDARNIRLTQRDGEGDTLYAITNEKGTELTSISIVGNYLGHALLNQYLVVFSRDDSGVAPPGYDDPIPDWITMIDLSTLTKRILYHGDLGFSVNYPISAIGFYENDNVQKVYWVDGKNQARVINIVGYVKPELDTQFDILPTLTLKELISVVKQTGSTGSFPSGVIQYMFTYYRKFGQESNIFYTTPLFYVSPLDRGGAPDEKVSNSFEIHIEGVDTNFDYLRIYSLQRTSLNSTPIARRVKDIEIETESSKYTFIDTGVEGELIDPTELLYKQKEAAIVDTLDQKDNTVFLGNIQYKHAAPPALSGDTNTPDITITSSTRTIKSKQGNTNSTYTYYNQLNVIEEKTVNDGTVERSVERSVPCGGFKRGEYYRLGVQFQDKYGKWSDPLFVSDEIEKEWPSVSQNGESEINLPTFKGTINQNYVRKLVAQGYIRARAVVVFPDTQDREILCQGVTCPTVYRQRDLSNIGEQCQSSWFFRPKHYTDEYLVSPSGAIAPVYEGEIPTSAELVGNSGSISAGTITSLPRQWEIQGYYKSDNRFKISSASDINVKLSTFHSPDIEFASDIVSQSFDYTRYKLVGYASIYKTLSDIDIQTKSPTISNMGSGFDHHSFVTEGARGIISGLFYDDFVVDEMSGSNPPYFRDYNEEKSSVKWLVYPWQRSGSLNNDINRPVNSGTRSAELLKKRISNLRYSQTNWLKSSSSSEKDSTLSPTSFITSNNITIYPSLFMEDTASIVKMGDTVYKGNVDTVLMPDLPDGYYFCFNDSISDAWIQARIAEIINRGDRPAVSSWLGWIKTQDSYLYLSSGDSFTSPAVAMNQTDFTSDSWWKTFAIAENQASAPTSITGMIVVDTDYGEAYIKDMDGNILGKRCSRSIGTSLKLVVLPQNGYEINTWTIGTNGQTIIKSRGLQEITITVNSSNEVLYYAHLNYVGNANNMVSINAVPSPANGGTITGAGNYAVGSTATLTATPNSGYLFDRWEDSNGGVMTSQTLTIPVSSQGGTYYAYFSIVSVMQTYIFADSRGEVNVGVGEEGPTVSNGETTYYPKNTIVRLSASTYSPNLFRNWVILDGLGCRVNTNSSYNLTIQAASTEIYANFYNPNDTTTYIQSIVFNSSEGSVSVNGQSWESGDAASYSIGETIILEAVGVTGYRFASWQLRDDDTATIIETIYDNPYAFTVSLRNCTIRAYFETTAGSYSVSYHIVPSAGGIIYADTGEEISIYSDRTEYYERGTNIDLRTEVNSGYVFSYWLIDEEQVFDPIPSLEVTTNHTVTAVFEQDESTKSTQSWSYSESRGSVSVNSSPVDSNTSTNYPIRTSLVLQATPMSEFDFYGWYIDGSLVQENPYSFVVSNSSHSISASFIEKQEQIKVYVTSNVVGEAGGYATITVGSSPYTIDSGSPTAEIPYVEGMIMTVSSSSTKTFSKWQYSTDGITYTNVPSSGNAITVSNQESNCYYKAIFN